MNTGRTIKNMKGKKLAFFYMLVFVSLIILFAEFFHVETVIGQDDDCPICLWERTSLSIATLNIFSCALLLVVIAMLRESVLNIVTPAYIFKLRGRSPPFRNLH